MPPPRKDVDVTRVSGRLAFTLAEFFSSHPKGQLRAAFTLAEVLITLGIIGVVAAITMPTLIAHHRKKALQTALLKTYSELQQVNLRLIADGINLYETDDLSPYRRGQLILSYFNDKYSPHDDVNWANINAGIEKVYNGKGIRSYDNRYIAHVTCDNGGIWSDNSGRLWLFNDGHKEICVDINGTKGPNRYGYDYFVFYPDKNNKIVPRYQNIEDKDRVESSTVPNTRDYTYYAIINRHPDDENKTYWDDYIKL